MKEIAVTTKKTSFKECTFFGTYAISPWPGFEVILTALWNRKRLISFALGAYSNRRTKMRNLLIAACCAALMGSVSVASAQTTGPTTQDSVKTNSPMDSNAKMKKKHKMKKSMKKSDDGMAKGDSAKEGMKKDTK
jgi:hypothetical protein